MRPPLMFLGIMLGLVIAPSGAGASGPVCLSTRPFSDVFNPTIRHREAR
jgi:hypothetical protein